MAKKKEVTSAPVNEFDEAVIASKNFVEKYEKAIVAIGGGVVAVVIAVLLVYQYYIVPTNVAAAEEMAYAEQQYRAGEYDKALNGDAENAGFLQIIDQYSWTKSGNLANLYAGICLVKQGKAQDALEYLESYDDCDDEMVSPAAMAAIGNCYAEIGNNEKAVKYLVKAAEEAENNTISPLCYMQAGMIYVAMGENDKALKLYETIKSDYPMSMQAGEIDKYIEALK